MTRTWWGASLVGVVALATGAGPAAAQAPANDELAKAVRKGVEYLKKQQRADGTWPHVDAVGATALAGWTLLECGVPPTDPAVQKAAAAFRKEVPDLTTTYSLALGIFFLDRLRDEAG